MATFQCLRQVARTMARCTATPSTTMTTRASSAAPVAAARAYATTTTSTPLASVRALAVAPSTTAAAAAAWRQPLRRNFASAAAAAAATERPPPPFKKLLVANRGEIAVRVMRSCKAMGIKTVAVHSEADAQAVHVKYADEAVCVGGNLSSDSYLRIDRILAAVKQTGAEAVHPGYGFLSENKEFSKALKDIGVAFVGPGEFAIEAMGDKIASKKLARDAKVNTVPGFLGVMEDEEEVVKVANDIGYPVMIKASAGGGGKGMRVAYNDDDARDGFRFSKQEALASFGDDTIFLEKFIEDPRHIEIQVLADSHGNTVYLNERECSIQRRNQKVIEEAPSTFLDAELRKQMGEQAVALAKACDYQSAGTVEFLVDKHKDFYFLEMNTRLQVEHPVTEMITGVDLVQQMIRVAAGETLSIKQSDIGIKGWAFESRVYAEDPLRGFLPSIGRLNKYVEPTTDGVTLGAELLSEPRDGDFHFQPTPFVRCDSGVREGSEISMYYDPMISKLVTYGADREEALQTMRTALDEYVIRGVTDNINFLRTLTEHPRFISGDISTKFIEQEWPDETGGYHGHVLTPHDTVELLAAAAQVHAYQRAVNRSVGFDGDVEQAEYGLSGVNEHFVMALQGRRFSVVVTRHELADDEYGFSDEFGDVGGTFGDQCTMRWKELAEGEEATLRGPQPLADYATHDFECNYNYGDDVFSVQVEAADQDAAVEPPSAAARTADEVVGVDAAVHAAGFRVPFGGADALALEGGAAAAPERSQRQVLQHTSNGSESLSYTLLLKGTQYDVQVLTPTQAALSTHMLEKVVPDMSAMIVSPMPGSVFSIHVKPGDTLLPGDEVCVVEAMKMQNALRTEKGGKVKAVHVEVGATVASDEVLVEFEVDEE